MSIQVMSSKYLNYDRLDFYFISRSELVKILGMLAQGDEFTVKNVNLQYGTTFNAYYYNEKGYTYLKFKDNTERRKFIEHYALNLNLYN